MNEGRDEVRREVPTRAERRPSGSWLLGLWAVSVTVWWGFAFFPAPAEDESWIATAQYACFGTPPGGTPAAQGWMLLVLAPLLSLACLFALQGGELRAAARRMLTSARGWAVAAPLLALFAVELQWASTRVAQQQRAQASSFESPVRGGLPRDYPRSAIPLPEFELVDQRGAPCNAGSFAGQPTVLGFVFANCQTVCPVLTRNILRSIATPAGHGAHVVLVTLDPWRDTPGTLASVASRLALPDGSRILSGEPAAVCRLLDTLQVARERDLQSGDVSHVPLVMIVDGRGRIAYRFSNPSSEWITEALRRVRVTAS